MIKEKPSIYNGGMNGGENMHIKKFYPKDERFLGYWLQQEISEAQMQTR